MPSRMRGFDRTDWNEDDDPRIRVSGFGAPRRKMRPSSGDIDDVGAKPSRDWRGKRLSDKRRMSDSYRYWSQFEKDQSLDYAMGVYDALNNARGVFSGLGSLGYVMGAFDALAQSNVGEDTGNMPGSNGSSIRALLAMMKASKDRQMGRKRRRYEDEDEEDEDEDEDEEDEDEDEDEDEEEDDRRLQRRKRFAASRWAGAGGRNELG